MLKEILFENYNSGDIKNAILESKNIIIPLGAIEAHSNHLTLGTDNVLVDYYSFELGKYTNSLVMPTIKYGSVWCLSEASGSININQKYLIEFVKDIIVSLEKNGAKMVTLVSSHFGNIDACKSIARELYSVHKIKVIYLTYPNINKYLSDFEVLNNHSLYLHACEVETSLVLYVDESKVDMSKAQKGTLEIPPETGYTPVKWTEFSENYIMGDARKATKEKGETLLKKVIADAVKIINKEKEEL